MSTIRIKLPPGLERRVVAAARAAGQAPQAFMLAAIGQGTALAEARGAFVQQALDARSSMEETGLGYEAAEVHAYLAARAQGRASERPIPKPWRG